MRHRLWLACSLALFVTLGAPTAANADVASVFGALDERRLSPPPLVPVDAPAVFSPFNETLTIAPSIRRSGYAVRLAKTTPSGAVIAVIFLERGAYRSVRQASAYYRRRGFTARSTRVRGRRGALLTRRLGGRVTRNLIWKEDGRVYELGSGTPRRVSPRQLRAAAADLEELKGYFIGSVTTGQELYHEANFGVTEGTVSGTVSWTASCVDAGGAPTQYAGTSPVELVPVRSNGFSFPLRDTREDAKPWTGTATGTVQANSVDVSFRATGSFDGLSCDTGQVALTLPRGSSGGD